MIPHQTRHAARVACEITGPPAAGKSTVLAALRGAPGVTCISRYKSTRRIPMYLRGVLEIAPVLARARVRPRTWQELNWMTRLETSPRILGGTRSPLAVFDQGPVYTLVRLHESLSDERRRAAVSPWIDSKLEIWRELLDIIFVLDAPDDVLIDRIERRVKAHAIKGTQDRDAREAIARVRETQGRVIEHLTSAGGPTLVRIDTAARSVPEVRTAVGAALGLGRTVP